MPFAGQAVAVEAAKSVGLAIKEAPAPKVREDQAGVGGPEQGDDQHKYKVAYREDD